MSAAPTWWFIDVLQLLKKAFPSPPGHVAPHFTTGAREQLVVRAVVRGAYCELPFDDDAFEKEPKEVVDAFVQRYEGGF